MTAAESDDTVNAVFRAIHSAKGGAGVFGFEPLVRFAHVFETVLDAVRHGTLSPVPDILDVLFSASDVLADLVAMARADEAAPAGYGDECRAALEGLLGQGEDGDADAAADDFDIPFIPVMVEDFEAASETAGERSYSISFRPNPDFPPDQDPLFLLQQLRMLGTLELAAQTDALPLARRFVAGARLYRLDRDAAHVMGARGHRAGVRLRGRQVRVADR